MRASAGLPSRCSGAMYAGVPSTMRLAVTVSSWPVFASPKSKTLIPDFAIMMFAGLRSRCTMPLLCASARAAKICAA